MMTSTSSRSTNKAAFNMVSKTALALITGLMMSSTFAADSAHHASKAGKHSALAVSAGAASTGKVASAVVAAPVFVVGGAMIGTGVGSAAVGSEDVGSKVATSGAASIGAAAHVIDNINHTDELVISEVIITSDPAPQAVMQKNTVHTTKTTITTQTTTNTQEKK